MIQVITITNPIEPSRDRETLEIEFEGQTLEQILFLEVRKDLADVEFDEWALNVKVSINGEIWPRSLWSEITPRDGDYIVLSPTIKGGGLMRTLASVALLAGTIALAASGAGAGLAAYLATAWTVGVSSATASAILVGAVNIVGNLLISAVLGPNAASNKTSSASYDPDGPRSLAQSGIVIPKGYGKMLWGGNIISSFTEIAGSDQWINVLVCFGFGPARSLTGIQINGKDISSYQNCQYYIRLGTNDQTEIGQFNQISNGYPQDTQCLAGVPVVVPGTGDLTQALQVDIQFTDGIFVNTSDGNIILAVITYKVEYAVSGTNNWQSALQPQTTTPVTNKNPDGSLYLPHAWGLVATDFPPNSGIILTVDDGPHTPGDKQTYTQTVETFEPNGNHSTYTKTFNGEWQLLDVNMNNVIVLTWTDGYVDFVAAQTTPCYNRTQILGLPPAKYDVRITKYGCTRLHDDVPFGDNWSPTIGQDMWVHSVNEITMLDLTYPNMILLGVRALATSQLSGSSLTITALIEHGLRTVDTGVMPAELLAFEEDNPALVAADMFLDDLYGGGAWPGITPANLRRYIDEWVAWAELNDTLVPDGNGNNIRLHVFNGVFDNEDVLWNQVNRVAQMSRAAIVPIGLDYGVFVDAEVDAPVQMFTVGNIIQDSFSEVWLPIDDRANQVEIQFADATRYYKSDNPIVYMDPDQQNAGVVVKNTRIKALGVTSPAQAWHLARYKQRSNQFLLRTGSFRTDTDGIACRVGSVIALQHDVPQWGWGGRTLPGSTTTRLLLDRDDIPFEAGTPYSVMVQHSAVLRYSGTLGVVTAPTSSTLLVQLSNFDNAQRVTRIVVNGYDALILGSDAGVITIGSGLPQGVSITAGAAYQLYDTDVLDSVAVASIDPATGALVLSTPLAQAPDDYSQYIYGQTGSVKLVRVTNITKATDFRSTIEWIDYDPNVFTVGTPVIGETSAITTSNPGVTSLTGSEIFTLVGGSYVSYASLSWKNGPDTVGVGIFATPTGTSGLPQLVARLTGAPTTWQGQIYVGNSYDYRVVGFDANNLYAAITTAPEVTINAVGIAPNLLLGSSFANGFTFWNISPRAGDTFAPTFEDDGEAIYTVAGTALTAAQKVAYQVIPASKWIAGQYLMLSGYVIDSCVSSSAPNVGQLILGIGFQDASGAMTTVQIAATLNGVQPTTTRYNTAAMQIPAGTVGVAVMVAFGGNGLNLPVGSTVTLSHLLLESAATAQTAPSAWADLDLQGKVLDIFTGGSSSLLRTQGSVLPTETGTIAYTSTETTVTITWTNLVILWPDGLFTVIPDGSVAITGLTASTTYVASLYYDVVLGGVHIAAPSAPLGTPGLLSSALDSLAVATCKLDNHVALTPTGLSVATAAAGATGGGFGGGNTPPPTCTLRGTVLPSNFGAISNEEVKRLFDAGAPVSLIGREGLERVRQAFWSPVEYIYRVEVEGYEAFECSGSLPMLTDSGRHIWVQNIPEGSRVDTVAGMQPMIATRIETAGEVLYLELEGPSHEYLVVDGVWTHNFKTLPDLPFDGN